MKLQQFLEQNAKTRGNFEQTMAIIAEHYHYQPSAFTNGLGNDRLDNAAGSNEGSCKIFAFALIHKLNQQQTLNLFGDYYFQEVLENPDRDNHQNIRNFSQYGWAGIGFLGTALIAK